MPQNGRSGKFTSKEEYIRRKKVEELFNDKKTQDENRVLADSARKFTSTDGKAKSQNTPWDEGRRIVELKVLEECLKSCTDCGEGLYLHQIVEEKRYGFSSLLPV